MNHIRALVKRYPLSRPVLSVGLLFGPFLLFFLAEALLLPLNAFTFRQWEAVLPRAPMADFAFFPKARLAQNEYGDVFRYEQLSKPGLTRWFTDAMGYRNREAYRADQPYCFVTLGDSNVIGASLDQTEMLSEALARKSNCASYNAASTTVVSRYFQRPEFAANPPTFLVLQSIAGHFYSDHAYSLFDSSGLFTAIAPKPSLLSRIGSASLRYISPEDPRSVPWVLDEVIGRHAGLQFVRARLGLSSLPSPPVSSRHNENRNIHGSSGPSSPSSYRTLGTARYPKADKVAAERDCPASIKAIAEVPAREANCRLIAVVKAIGAAARTMGSEVILYLQPSSDVYLAPGIALLQTERHRVIHFPHSQKLPYGIDFDWYWASQDTHWHPRAVELAADLIIAESRERQVDLKWPEIHDRIAREMQRIRRP